MTKAQRLLTTFLSSLCMAFLMSGIITAINTGIDGELVFRWMRSFAMGFPIALVISVILLPKIRQFSAYLSRTRDKPDGGNC
ncbi:DUF2798 domain-containing protein [Veronia pacifica]|uniref:DUF2798 domain-containing protein n=1 Tax=Veronia pacifica TaxID=1080227 RepID=UPI0009F49458|nr:DUF2798 domain-containing protein [Veronia pacifica]